MDLLQELTELSTKYAINLDSLIIKLDIEQSTRGVGLEDVWVGTYKEDRVAVKALRGVWVNRSVMRPVLREIHRWCKLKHKNILSPLGILTDFCSTSVGMVSPWMAKGTAIQYLSDNQEIDPCDLVADGLQFLHENDVLHGSLKGSNVLISDSGDALLCDFGLSILVESSFNVSAFRDQDLVRWMAPEALREEGPSTKCDVYAFGMTALELFSREQPYSNVLDPSDVCTAVMKGVIPARPNDDATLERLNDAWWSLCCACWESDPDSRPAAQHVVDSLKTIDRNVTRLKGNKNVISATDSQVAAPDQEYDQEYESVLQRMEISTMPSIEAMDKQSHLSWRSRPRLVKFLIRTHSDFNFLPETLYLAINIVDRYFSCCPVHIYTSDHEVIGCSALRIAAKYEEILGIPSLPVFVSQCYDCDMRPFIRMECRILSAIGWKLGHPTAESRLRQFCYRLGVEDTKTQNVARFLMEITLYYREFIQYTPSAIAMAALTFARILCGDPQSVYTETDQCLEIIGYLHIRLSKSEYLCPTLIDKYSEERFSDAATFVLQSPAVDGFFRHTKFAAFHAFPCSHPTNMVGSTTDIAAPMIICS